MKTSVVVLLVVLGSLAMGAPATAHCETVECGAFTCTQYWWENQYGDPRRTNRIDVDVWTNLFCNTPQAYAWPRTALASGVYPMRVDAIGPADWCNPCGFAGHADDLRSEAIHRHDLFETVEHQVEWIIRSKDPNTKWTVVADDGIDQDCQGLGTHEIHCWSVKEVAVLGYMANPTMSASLQVIDIQGA